MPGREAPPPEELLCGTEAWQSCPALLPVAWNVSKPARETKTQPRPRQGEAAGAGLTVHVHHPWGRAVLWSGHFRAALLVLALLLVLVFLEEKWDRNPVNHPSMCVFVHACVCVCVSLSCVSSHMSGSGEWHKYLIPSNSQNPQALAGCLCLYLNVAHEAFLRIKESHGGEDSETQSHLSVRLLPAHRQTPWLLGTPSSRERN